MRPSARARREGRWGFTATEVMVAVAVLAVAVLPVMLTTTSSSKNVRLTEYHVIAQTRAKRLLEAYGTYGLEELRGLSAGGGELPAPFLDGGGAEFDLPEEYRRKMENFAERAYFEDLQPDLGVVHVEVRWTVEGRQLEYTLFRFVGAGSPATVARPALGGG
ncbi:MAG: prepilin-type N-terminal cleavage/methylation domain-containing protein [Myxococcales bacterium]|nr:prepilin-type N-terminal cleavage/methylation domain-containing protein [Myxococcales bacterium]